jgi:hypothetical protein
MRQYNSKCPSFLKPAFDGGNVFGHFLQAKTSWPTALIFVNSLDETAQGYRA